MKPSMNSARLCQLISIVYETLLTHGDLLVLNSPGYASVIAFHQGAAGTLRVVKDDGSDDIDNAICQVANQIVTECKNVENDKTLYNTS